jgi:drug/metabolite transporter (DMT)-like permease
LICGLESGNWNRGDAFVLACALTAAIQIVLIHRAAEQISSPFVFNSFQSFWAGVIPAVFALKAGGVPHLPLPLLSWFGLLFLVGPVTLGAFMVQVRAQRVLPSSLVSMIFLLESPCAAFFAHFLFQERLAWSQWSGAFLILLSAVGAVYLHTSVVSNPPAANPSLLLPQETPGKQAS